MELFWLPVCLEGRVFVHNDCLEGRVFALFKLCPGGGGGGGVVDEIDKLHNINSSVSFFNTVYIHPSSEVEGHDTHADKSNISL